MPKPQNWYDLEPGCNHSKGDATSNLSANLYIFITKCSQHLKNYQNICNSTFGLTSYVHNSTKSIFSQSLYHKVFRPVVFYNISLKMPTLQSTLKVLNSCPNVVNILFKTWILSNRAMHWNQEVFFLKGELMYIQYVHICTYMGVSLDPIGSERIAKMSNIIFYQKLVTPLNFS